MSLENLKSIFCMVGNKIDPQMAILTKSLLTLLPLESVLATVYILQPFEYLNLYKKRQELYF